MYNPRNINTPFIPQMNPMDFYNYLQFLNFGGLVKASTGTEDITKFQPWNSKVKGYGDLTLDGEDFNPYDEGEFTTSKIEKDRRKNQKLFEKREDYLYDDSGDHKANWWNADLDPKDDPLRKKSWTLHNTSDEEMYYDKSNPTKLYNKEEWDAYTREDLVNRSIDMLNTRHTKNPELFQKVTGYNPDTGEIFYAGDKLQGDLFSEKNPDADYLQFWNPDDPDNLTTDGSFTGALYEDVEVTDADGNITHPGGNIKGKTTDPFGEEDTSTYAYQDNPDNPIDTPFENPSSSAQIGLELERPYLSPRSQMDTMTPIPTVGKFNTGGGHVGPSGTVYQSSFDTQDELFNTDEILPGMYDQNMYHFNPNLEEKIDEDPNDEYQWGPNPEIKEPPTEVEEKKDKTPWKNDIIDVFGAIVPAIGQVNQMLENRPKNKMFNQLAHNQFSTDTRDNRGNIDTNTGMAFQDKRVRSTQGAYGTELKKAENGDEYFPISETGAPWLDYEYMNFDNPYLDSYFLNPGGSSILHPDSLQYFPPNNELEITRDNSGIFFNPYWNSYIDPASEMIFDVGDDGSINFKKPGDVDDTDYFNWMRDDLPANLHNLGLEGYQFNPTDTNFVFNPNMENFDPYSDQGLYNEVDPDGGLGNLALEGLRMFTDPSYYFSDPIKTQDDDDVMQTYGPNVPTFWNDAYNTAMNTIFGVGASAGGAGLLGALTDNPLYRKLGANPNNIINKLNPFSKGKPIRNFLTSGAKNIGKGFGALEGLNFFIHAAGNDIENWWPMKNIFMPVGNWLDENMPKDYDTKMMRDTPFAMNTNLSAPYADSKGLWRWMFPDSWFPEEETPEYPGNPGGYASRYAMYKDMPQMMYNELDPNVGYFPVGTRSILNYINPDHFSYKGEGNYYEDLKIAPPRYDKHAARNPMGGDNWSDDMIKQYEDWLISEGHWPEDHVRWDDWDKFQGLGDYADNNQSVSSNNSIEEEIKEVEENNKTNKPPETKEEKDIRMENKPWGYYINEYGTTQQSKDNQKVGRNYSKEGDPWMKGWDQERVDHLFEYDPSLAGDKDSNYGWINRSESVWRHGGDLPKAPDGNELNSDAEIDLNFLNYGQCKGGGCKERGNVGFGASAFGGLEGDFTDMESTLAQLGLKGNLDLRSPMGFGANLSGEGGIQDYLSNVAEGNINPNPFYGGRLNLGYASPEQVFLSNDPYATPYPGFNVGAYGEYDSNRGPNFGVEGGWGPLSIMGGYNLDQQSPFFGAKLNVNLEEGGESRRTTQLRNRQYDDIDTTIELDDDTIQQLIAAGAEIEYV
jgi:hypothetical protein